MTVSVSRESAEWHARLAWAASQTHLGPRSQTRKLYRPRGLGLTIRNGQSRSTQPTIRECGRVVYGGSDICRIWCIGRRLGTPAAQSLGRFKHSRVVAEGWSCSTVWTLTHVSVKIRPAGLVVAEEVNHSSRVGCNMLRFTPLAAQVCTGSIGPMDACVRRRRVPVVSRQ